MVLSKPEPELKDNIVTKKSSEALRVLFVALAALAETLSTPSEAPSLPTFCINAIASVAETGKKKPSIMRVTIHFLLAIGKKNF